MRVLRVCRVQKAAERHKKFRVMYGELIERRKTLPSQIDRFISRVDLLGMETQADELASGSKYSVYRS